MATTSTVNAWDAVCVGLGTAGEETQAFGQRREVGTALYRVETQATVCASGGGGGGRNDGGEQGTTSASAVVPPHVFASASDSGLCLCVDTQVHLFDAACSTLQTTVGLGECCAELAAWSKDCSFVVVADSSGAIHLVDVASKNVLFSRALLPANSCCSDSSTTADTSMFSALTFTSKKRSSGGGGDGTYGLHVVARNGTLFDFTGLDLDTMREYLDAGDIKAAASARKSIQMTTVDLTSAHPTVVRGLVPTRVRGRDALVVWGPAPAPLSLWKRTSSGTNGKSGSFVLTDRVERTLAGCGVAHCDVDATGTHLVVLTDTGCLTMWHLPSLVMVRQHIVDYRVRDFVLVPGNGMVGSGGGGGSGGVTATATSSTLSSSSCPNADNEGSEAILVALTCGGVDSGSNGDGKLISGHDEANTHPGTNNHFRVLAAHTFSERYSLEVNPAAWIARVPDQETLYLIEARRESIDDELSLLVRCLEPTLPTNRFYHLLHKHRFDEAMAIARQFGLDADLVHRVKATAVLDRADKVTDAGVLTELKHCLEAVTDIEFVVDSCLGASLPDVASVQMALEYALMRVGLETCPDSMLRSRLLGALKRLATYQMAAPTGPLRAHDWHRFRTVDLQRECVAALTSGRIGTAAVIWARHRVEYSLAEHVPALLSAVPEWLSCDAYLPWLRDQVLPVVVREHHGLVLDWIARRARGLELREKAAWPTNSLALIESASEILQLHSGAADGPLTVTVIQHDVEALPAEFLDRLCGCPEDEEADGGGRGITGHGSGGGDAGMVPLDTAAISARELLELRDALVEILELRTTYELQLSLAEYDSQDASSVVMRLLDRVVAPELVAGVVESEVSAYLSRTGSSLDTHLLDYLRDLMGRNSASSTTGGAPWEGKAIAVVSCLGDVNVKVEAVLEIMRRVVVPCSEDVRSLVEQVETWEHSKQAEFREQSRIMRLKEMLLPYGLSDFNLSDTRLARGLMRHLAARIDSEESLAHALQVVDAYHNLSAKEVYVARMRRLVYAQRTHEAVDLFLALPGSGSSCGGTGGLSDGAAAAAAAAGSKSLVKSGSAVTAMGTTNAPVGCSGSTASRDRDTGISSQALAFAVGREYVVWAMDILGSPFTLPEDAETHVAAASVAVNVLQQLLARRRGVLRQDECDELRAQFKLVHSLLGLMTRFDKFLTPAEYDDDNLRLELLEERLAAVMAARGGGVSVSVAADGSGLIFEGQGAFYQFAHLLGFSRNQVVAMVARKCAASSRGDGRAAFALHLCRDTESRSPTPAVARIMCEVAYHLAVQQGSSGAAGSSVRIDDCLALASRALAIVDQHDICDCLELARACEMASEISAHCENGGVEDVVTSTGDYARSLRETRFHEDGLVLESSSVLPLAAKFVGAVVSFSHRRPWPHEHRRVGGCLFGAARTEHLVRVSGAAKEVFGYLATNSLIHVALRYANAAFGACAQHASTNSNSPACQERFALIAPRATDVVKGYCAKLLTKVLGAPLVDKRLAMGYIACLSLKESFSRFSAAVKSTKRNYGKLAHVAAVGTGFSALWCERDFLQECQALHKNAGWWDTLAKIGVAFDKKQFERGQGEYVRRLLPTVLSRPNAELSTAIELAAAYQVPADAVALTFARLVLTTLEDPGAAEIEALLEHPGNVWSRAMEQLMSTTDKPEAIRALMEQCLPQVSPYAYGHLHFILLAVHQLGAVLEAKAPEKAESAARYIECASSWAMLLSVLRRYRRTAAPGAYEKKFSVAAPDTGAGACSATTSGGAAAATRRSERASRRRGAASAGGNNISSSSSSSSSSLPESSVLSHSAASAEPHLPFHHMVYGDPWKTLRPELSLETVSLLLPVARLLSLSADDFLVEVIEKAVTECGDRQMVSPRTFETMCNLLGRMSDPETAIMTAKLIADGLPLSNEKIRALEMGVRMTETWALSLKEAGHDSSKTGEKARIVQDRLANLYRRTATELDLSAAGIEDGAILALIDKPPELICKLYELYACGERAAALRVRGGSLSALQARLASRYGLSAEKLRNFLIRKWLVDTDKEDKPPVSSSGTADEGGNAGAIALSLGNLLDDEPAAGSSSGRDSVNSGVASNGSSVSGGSGGGGAGNGSNGGDVQHESGLLASLRRVIALLRLGKKQETIEYLLRFAFVEDSHEITAAARQRAFVTLFHIAPLADICQVSRCSLSQLRAYAVGLGYVSRLEEVHVSQTVSEFHDCNKDGLVRGLWRNRNHEPCAVRLVSDLMFDYELYDLDLWNAVLKQLLATRQFAYLTRLLDAISGVPCLWEAETLSATWKAVIEHHLHLADCIFDTDAVAAEIHGLAAFRLMASAPFVLRTDLRSACECFRGLGLWHLAAGAALMLPAGSPARDQVLGDLFGADNGEAIVSCLDQATAAGDKLPLAQKVRELALSRVDSSGLYAALLPTRHFDGLVKYLVAANNINGLLAATLAAGRLPDAVRLITHLNRVHPIEVDETEQQIPLEEGGGGDGNVKLFTTPPPPLEGEALLAAYVRKYDLEECQDSLEDLGVLC